METPPPEPPVRRTTRSALVEIPARMGALSVTDNIRPTPNGNFIFQSFRFASFCKYKTDFLHYLLFLDLMKLKKKVV